MTFPKFLIPLLIPLCAVQTNIEVPAQDPLTERILFVVDRSGSMHGDHFSRALAAFREIATTPTDNLEIAVIAFSDNAVRWPGKTEVGVSPKWALLPSKTAVAEAEAWLASLGAGGDTLIIPALRAALAEPRTKLSVVVVTDGLFGRERTDDIAETIRDYQDRREKAGHGRAVIGVYGLGSRQKPLTRIAEVGRGGYIRELPNQEE